MHVSQHPSANYSKSISFFFSLSESYTSSGPILDQTSILCPRSGTGEGSGFVSSPERRTLLAKLEGVSRPRDRPAEMVIVLCQLVFGVMSLRSSPCSSSLRDNAENCIPSTKTLSSSFASLCRHGAASCCFQYVDPRLPAFDFEASDCVFCFESSLYDFTPEFGGFPYAP